MNQVKSVYTDLFEKYFRGLVVKIVEKLNDKSDGELSYLFKEYLRKEYSPTGKWEAISILNSRVSADFVAMDSSLPLKLRDSIGKASGDIAKSGMELWFNETQLTNIDTMIAQGLPDAEIVSKLLADVPRVVAGIYELMERCFLEGLSKGVTSLDDKDNVGTGVRLDYGYLTANKFGVKVLWNNSEAKPLDDFKKVRAKAKVDGNKITTVFMDDVTLDHFLSTKQVVAFFARSRGFREDAEVVNEVPSLEDVNKALKKDHRYKFEIVPIDRTIKVERDGKRSSVTPWDEGKVIFTCSKELGVYAYARLAEQNHPVAGVEYETADDMILVSKFRQNRPSIAEFTTSQARVVPVICNVESIYQLDSKQVQG